MANVQQKPATPAHPEYSRSKKLIGQQQTNNRAEYSALIILCIYTDSNLLVNTVNFWLKGWKERGWKKKDNTTPKNLDLLREIDTLVIPFQLKWNPAHTGGQDYFSLNNAKVDRMAVEAVDF